MLLLTLPGTLTIYYGEELGMTNVSIPPEDVLDPAEKNQPGIGMGRDPERTPMPWDCSEMAGFTRGRPWLPIGDDHQVVNVEIMERRRNIHLKSLSPIDCSQAGTSCPGKWRDAFRHGLRQSSELRASCRKRTFFGPFEISARVQFEWRRRPGSFSLPPMVIAMESGSTTLSSFKVRRGWL